MTDIAAAIGISNFKDIDSLVNVHRNNSKYYNEQLKDVSGIQLLENNPDHKSSCWLYTMRVKNRSDFVKKLESKGIASNPVHARCDKHSCVYKYRSSLPNMDVLGEDMICIPVVWWVTEEDREYIVKTIKEGW